MISPLPVALSFSLLVLSSAAAQEPTVAPVKLKDTVPHLVTFGFAKADVVPDLADITTGVENTRKTAEAATEATATAAQAVIAKIKARGIDAKDIKTSFDLEAKYDIERNDKGVEVHRTLQGYDAVEQIYIHLRDVKAAGALAREMIDEGANSFGGISFSYSKEKEATRELQGEAIRDALAQAKAYTSALGLKLGRVLQIGDDETNVGEADLPRRAPGIIHAPVAVPVEPGTQDLSENVAVIWEIEGKAP